MNDLVTLFNDYAGDYSAEELIEELFGEGVTIGDILSDHYNAGLIPTDRLEAFLLDD